MGATSMPIFTERAILSAPPDALQYIRDAARLFNEPNEPRTNNPVSLSAQQTHLATNADEEPHPSFTAANELLRLHRNPPKEDMPMPRSSRVPIERGCLLKYSEKMERVIPRIVQLSPKTLTWSTTDSGRKMGEARFSEVMDATASGVNISVNLASGERLH